MRDTTLEMERVDNEDLLQREVAAIGKVLGLSKREIQIISRVCVDEKDASIATTLGISTHTVRTHFDRMYRKLGVSSRCELLLTMFRAYLRRQAAQAEPVSHGRTPMHALPASPMKFPLAP